MQNVLSFIVTLRGRDPRTILRPWLQITAACAFSTIDDYSFDMCIYRIKFLRVRLCHGLTVSHVNDIYRPGNMAVSDNFFDQFADRLKSLTNYSFVLLVGDVNIHLDYDLPTDTIKFNEILDAHNITQHVQCLTHVGVHLLDVFLTRQSPSYVAVILEDRRAATWRAVRSLDDHCQCRSVERRLRRYSDAGRGVLVPGVRSIRCVLNDLS